MHTYHILDSFPKRIMFPRFIQSFPLLDSSVTDKQVLSKLSVNLTHALRHLEEHPKNNMSSAVPKHVQSSFTGALTFQGNMSTVWNLLELLPLGH